MVQNLIIPRLNVFALHVGLPLSQPCGDEAHRPDKTAPDGLYRVTHHVSDLA